MAKAAITKKLLLRHADIKKKLTDVALPNGESTKITNELGYTLEIAGQTVRNYLAGRITDGYLAEAIYEELERLNYIK